MGTEIRPGALATDGATRRAADVVADAYEHHRATLVRFVLARTHDPESAADVVQETFLRLLNEVARGRTPELMLPWLRQVALNLVVSRARRATVAQRWEPWLRAAADPAESPERSVLSLELDTIVRQAVESLPDAERAALVLAANGYAGREIAQAIGRSEGATRTLMCRARSRLRTELVAIDPAR